MYSIDVPGTDAQPQFGLFFTISGWVYLADAPIVAVAVYARSLSRGPLAITPLHPRADVAGVLSINPSTPTAFKVTVNLIGLEPADDIIVTTLTADQLDRHRAKPGFPNHHFDEIATIEVEIVAERRPAAEPRITPVFITSQGRSGSTALMRTMLISPMVTAVDEAPWEARILSYYLISTRMVVSPANGLVRGDNEKFSDIYTSSINNPFLNGADYPALFTEMSQNAVEFSRSLGDMFLETVVRVLPKALSKVAVSSNLFFIEKSSPGSCIPNLARSLWPNTREIFLTREAREWFMSGVRFSARTDRYFGQDILEKFDDFFLEVKLQIEVGIDYFNRYKESMIHIKYEDLVDRPSDTLVLISRYLGEPMPAALSGDAGDHATQETPESERLYEELLLAHPEIAEHFSRWNCAFGHKPTEL